MALLELNDLRINFGGVRALKGVSLQVDEGELLSLIGPNGAGKTTVFNCINGIYKPDSGSIRFNGRELIRMRPDKIARLGLARTFQNIELFKQMTTLDNLLLGRHMHIRYGLFSGLFFTPNVMRQEMAHRRRVEEIMDILDLQFARDQVVGNLPYGIQKLVEIGRAIALEPEILLLDEPFAGMNSEEKLDMVFRLSDIRAEFCATILLVEHDITTVMNISDRVVAMNEGVVIASGKPDEVQRHPEVITAYLGEDKAEGEADSRPKAGG
jgi:branched-chain amino acid transport system ATP-binding protein